MNADEYGRRLLTDRAFLRREYRRYVGNCYQVEGLTGVLTGQTLERLISKAYRSRSLRSMLAELLWYIDGSALEDRLFRRLLRFPKKSRNNFCGTLAHLRLPFYQMQILNRHSNAFEAFGWLLDQMAELDIFTVEDMLQLLRESADVTAYGMNACIDLAQERYGPNPKLEAARKWVATHKAND